MFDRKNPLSLDCGAQVFQEVVRGKWKIELIYRIDAGVVRPGDLQRAITGADRRVIDQQLGELVASGVLIRNSTDEGQLKTEYTFTELGLTILPVIRAIEHWGTSHRKEVEALMAQQKAMESTFAKEEPVLNLPVPAQPNSTKPS